MKFLSANLGLVQTPLADAMAAMLTVRRPTGFPGGEVALGWHIVTTDDKKIVWHNGGTGGYRSFIGFDPTSRIGVVALSNTESPEGVDDIGRHLLDEKVPLWGPGKEPHVVQFAPKVFDGYVGTYQLAPKVSIEVTREGNHLYAQTTGDEKVEIFPESQKEYFVKGADVRLTFVTGSQGRASEVIVREGGSRMHAKRVE